MIEGSVMFYVLIAQFLPFFFSWKLRYVEYELIEDSIMHTAWNA